MPLTRRKLTKRVLALISCLFYPTGDGTWKWATSNVVWHPRRPCELFPKGDPHEFDQYTPTVRFGKGWPACEHDVKGRLLYLIQLFGFYPDEGPSKANAFIWQIYMSLKKSRTTEPNMVITAFLMSSN
jgi:hypothetical protein